jgi:hypothetical protein
MILHDSRYVNGNSLSQGNSDLDGRHSDIRLTFGICTHTNLKEKQRAVESLPKPREYIGSKSESETGNERPEVSPGGT